MARQFSGQMRFDVAPDVVFAAQCDPEYVVWKHEHMASFDVSAQVEHSGAGSRITSSRKLPAVVPAAAKPFVGDAITVEEVHLWSDAAPDGSRTGTVQASFPGAPMSVSGTLALRPEGVGSVLAVDITSKASVPLVGGKLEEVVGEQFMRALRKEEQIAPQWFDA